MHRMHTGLLGALTLIPSAWLLSIATEPSVPTTIAEVRAGLVVRAPLPKDAPEGPTNVTLLSKQSFQGIFAVGQGRSIERGSDRVLFENVGRGTYLLAARHETPSKLVREVERAAERAGEVPRTGAIWWAFAEVTTPDVDDVELVLKRGSEQAFLVRTSEAAPAAKLTIRCALKSAEGLTSREPQAVGDPFQMEKRVKTREGRFVLEGLIPGEWAFVVQVTDHGRTDEFTLTIPGSGQREVLVPRFVELAGTLIGADGKPVEGGWIGMEYPTTCCRVFEDAQVATRSEAGGAFRITNARPGTGTLRARSTDGSLVAEQEIVIVPDKDQRELRLELRPAREGPRAPPKRAVGRTQFVPRAALVDSRVARAELLPGFITRNTPNRIVAQPPTVNHVMGSPPTQAPRSTANAGVRYVIRLSTCAGTVRRSQ
jgi:hypothetical protein